MKTLGVTRLGAVALLCCAHITSAMAITFTHDAFISFSDLSKEGQDIVVTNCTLTVDGPHTFNSLHLLNGGVLTHSALPYGPQQFTFSVSGEPHVLSATNAAALNNTNVDTSSIVVMNISENIFYTENVDYVVTVSNQYILLTLTTNSSISEGSSVLVDYDWDQTFQGFTLTINSDAQILTGGAIDISGKGYAGGIGANNGAGTSHATNFPFAFTAGGGAGHGGAGGMSSSSARGGATYDSTTNPATLGCGGGTGSADGGAGGGVATLFVGGNFQIDGQFLAGGFRGTNAHSGGGSGGSIFISAQDILGAGFISANGGSGDTPDGGGGGGGRIAIYFGANNFTGNISAFGGGGSMAGGAGTVYLQSNANPAGQLFIVNGGKRGTNTTFSAPVTDLTISGGAILQPPILPLTITNLFLGSNSVLMSLDSLALSITVNGNATVEANAFINADFKSSGSTGSGPGGGAATCGAGSGGSYGGYGGASVCGTPGGQVYGSIVQPLNFGSPGASGIHGGGAIKMTVAGTLSLAGTISANGASAVAATSGSGSGGSVWLTAGTFSGTGTVSANGGSSSNLVSGGGGGGRVAVYFNTNFFTGNITAHGGKGTNSGGPGSVYLKNNSDPVPQIVYDNGNLAGMSYASTSLPMSDLTISGGTVLTNNQSSTLFLRTLFIGSNSSFTPFPGYSSGLTATVTNLTVQPGGAITVDGGSISTGLGAGQGSTFGAGGGGGGGFGGAGISNAPGGIAVVTSISFPSSGGGLGGSGSGLGPAPGGTGGGVISLTVADSLALNGRISANGLAGSGFNSGGGGGGSIRLSVRTLTGSGSISANGGAGNNFGGGGAGGAIALLVDSNLFSGSITAVGGAGANYGGAGPIYTTPFTLGKTPSLLVLDNGGNRGARTPLATTTDISDLTITGGAVVSNATVTFSVLRNLLVASNSALQVFPIFSTSSTMISVSSNVTILAGGSLSSDGVASSGGGTGQTLNSTGGGGGNAGTGGRSALGAEGGNAISDSISSPTSVGGRGGFGVNQIVGGLGGGTLRLTVGGTLLVNGRISADGGTSTNSNSGGGAGGSVSLSTKAFLGNGIISASGGAGNAAGGGGGGGHIAVSYTTNGFTGSLMARGGAGANYGGAGIIYASAVPGPIATTTQLILDNGGVPGGVTPFFATVQGNNISLTVTGGAILTNAFITTLQSLFIGSNSTWTLTSPSLFNLTILTNAVIQTGGRIAADGISSTGPSPGQTVAGKGGGGGGHGGYGGASFSNAPGGNVTSDSIPQPTSMGSVGGSSGGFGGGALEINVRGALQLDGKLSVSGATSSTSINSGGGSGGSIWLIATKLTGSGIISANGGPANNLGGGGGGGRIAVWCSTNLFAGTMMARGGSGANSGGAGTVFLNPSTSDIRTTAQLVLDNGGTRGTNTAILTSLNQISVVITNGAAMSLGLATTPVWNNLTISSNSSLTLASNFNSLHLQINSNFDLQAGGTLNLDGQGFPVNSGAGFGSAGSGHGAGGGHGGYGSAGNSSNSIGGLFYDSISNPNAAGSGGGSTFPTSGSAGGGAAQLMVNGICTINGLISASGAPGTASGAGGGAGGGIMLTAGTISGSGKIKADGGDGDIFTSGGGGGGRIAVFFNTNHFAGSLSAHGGAGVGLAGGAGTIYWKTNNPALIAPGDLVVDNAGSPGTNTPISTLNPPAALSIRNSGTAVPVQSLTLQSLSIGDGSRFIDSTGSLNLTVLGDVLVDTNGSISVDDDGYNSGFVGPGTGQVDFAGEGGGGGYGGAGGASYFGAAGGSTYGSSNQPVDLGSPGGMSPVVIGFSSGGGAIRLTANGTLTVNGRISANGADGFVDGAGGGAGGSIWVMAKKLLGTGSITANGGMGESFEGGGGGGGRIAIYTQTNSFAGSIFAAGGDGTFPGQDGTIYQPTALLISGSVTNADGAAVPGIMLKPSGLASVISDTNGYYLITVPPVWSGSIVPSGSGIIVPSIRTFSNLTLDTPNQGFLIASPAIFNFSGGQFDGTNATFNWYGVNGAEYLLLSSSNLVDWVPYGQPIIGGGAPITVTVPPTNAPNLYLRLNVVY